MSRVVKRTKLKNGYTFVESYSASDYLIISLIASLIKLTITFVKVFCFSINYYILKVLFFLIRTLIGLFINKETSFWKVINDKKYINIKKRILLKK